MFANGKTVEILHFLHWFIFVLTNLSSLAHRQQVEKTIKLEKINIKCNAQPHV